MTGLDGKSAEELMESLNPRLIKECFTHLQPHAEKITAYFYARLFAERPALRTLFPPSMETGRDRLFRAIGEIVAGLDTPGASARLLAELGRAHRTFGVCADHYPIMGRAMRATLRRYAGPGWTAEMDTAWTTAYEAASDIMIQAAEEDATARPAWWVGEVVGHDRRTPDIAVLTVRPDQRLPYAAGQYTTVQTARWPRVWRPYSIACAPRDDGLLRFHVRARPAGWVGGALVRYTGVGDTLLLGPATGAMTLDPDSRRDVLCVAGGTGLGPLRALTEAALRTSPERRVHLLVGARTAAELYDLPDLQAMADRHPGLEVVPVVSGDPGFAGMRGRVADVLDRFPDWSGNDVYVAGPPAMVARTVANLRDLGVPADHIRHDPLAETAPTETAPAETAPAETACAETACASGGSANEGPAGETAGDAPVEGPPADPAPADVAAEPGTTPSGRAAYAVARARSRSARAVSSSAGK